MPVYRLPREPLFPSPAEAEPDGLLAVGGDLSPERLLVAYASGIFPWPAEGYPLLWFSPDPRSVLPPAELRVGRRLARALSRHPFELSLDRAFRQVVEACAGAPRPGGAGTWITAEMAAAYGELHRLGFAHSIETWRQGELVGGLYGVSLGGIFVGESMFHHVPDASKASLVTLARQLERRGFELFDAQMPSPLLHRLGARDWPRARYLEVLAQTVARPTWRGPWRLDADLAGGAALRSGRDPGQPTGRD